MTTPTYRFRHGWENAPVGPGVYMLLKDGLCLYVGSTVRLRSRIKNHEHRDKYDVFGYFECAEESLRDEEQRLTDEMKPTLMRSQRVWRPGPGILATHARAAEAERPSSALRLAREQRGWTQRELQRRTQAAGLKIEQATLSRIENSIRSHSDLKQSGASPAQASVLSRVLGHALSEAQILFPGDHLPLSDRIKAEHYRPRVAA